MSTSSVYKGEQTSVVAHASTERTIRLDLWISTLIGGVFAVSMGIVAGKPGMIDGAIAGAILLAFLSPLVARFWARRGGL